MTNEEIIDGLKFTMEMCLYNPTDGSMRPVSTLNDMDKTTYDACEGAIKLLEQQRWIPVSERLPEEQRKIGEYIFSENVLGTEGYTIRRAYYNYTSKEWFDGNEETVWDEITHWMPLPEEPPMAESEEEIWQ